MHKINASTFEIEASKTITSHKERALPLVISQNNLYVVSESSIECYTIDAFSSCGSEAFATGEKISNMAAYSDTVIYSTIREVSVFDDNATIHTTEFKKFGTPTFEPLLNYKQARDVEINGETYGFIGDSKHTSLTIHEDNAYLPGINTNRLLTWPDLIVSQNVTLDLISTTPFTRTLNNDASKQSQNGQAT
tara:strand:- start:3004 stop:3579 length:576 start_codon:yes stop_codon:yes gene_type:complete